MFSFMDSVMVFGPMIWCRVIAMILSWFFAIFTNICSVFAIICCIFLLSLLIIQLLSHTTATTVLKRLLTVTNYCPKCFTVFNAGLWQTWVEDEYTIVTVCPGIAMTTKEEEEEYRIGQTLVFMYFFILFCFAWWSVLVSYWRKYKMCLL